MTLEAARHIATAAAGYYMGGVPPLGANEIPKPASLSRWLKKEMGTFFVELVWI